MGVFFRHWPKQRQREASHPSRGQKIAFAHLCSLLENERWINYLQQKGQSAEKTIQKHPRESERCFGRLGGIQWFQVPLPLLFPRADGIPAAPNGLAALTCWNKNWDETEKNTMTSTSSLQSSKKEWGWREWNFKNSRYSNVAMQPWVSESIYLHKNCLIQTQMLSPRPDPVEYDPCHGLGSGHAVDCYPSPQRACSKSSEKLTVLALSFRLKKNVFPTHFFRIWWVWRSSKIWRIFQIQEGTPTASRLGCRCKSLAQVLEFKESISICFHMKLYKHKNNKYPTKIHWQMGSPWIHHESPSVCL